MDYFFWFSQNKVKIWGGSGKGFCLRRTKISVSDKFQLVYCSSNESRMNEVPCPKLLSCKIEEIKKAYFEITHKLDHFYHDLSRLYSSSISWMDLNFLHRSEEARTMLNSKIFYDGMLFSLCIKTVLFHNEICEAKKMYTENFKWLGLSPSGLVS